MLPHVFTGEVELMCAEDSGCSRVFYVRLFQKQCLHKHAASTFRPTGGCSTKIIFHDPSDTFTGEVVFISTEQLNDFQGSAPSATFQQQFLRLSYCQTNFLTKHQNLQYSSRPSRIFRAAFKIGRHFLFVLRRKKHKMGNTISR